MKQKQTKNKHSGSARARSDQWTMDMQNRLKSTLEDNLVALHFKYDQARRRFVEWAQNEIAVVPDFHKRILFSDEAHFWLNGYVNKQNCRIWSEANSQVYVKTPLHPEKLTFWCALWAGGIIGPYFFKNDEGHNVTVNGDRYRAMITNFFIPELNNHYVQELWFQQDGATCHTARATIDLLKDTFGDRLISRFGPVNWPPRSCDLTPLDYFLWGYVKSLVYADKPQTLDHLEDNIRRVIADIRPQMLEKVIENWTSRLDYIQASRGSHMPEIIFKISYAEPVDFLIVGKITEFTPSSSLDISKVEIPKFVTLADRSFYEANEVHALISADIFFKVLKQNTYKVNEELFFKESEFGWIACGKLEERQINKQGQCFLVSNDSVQDTLKLFFDLEGLGIRDDQVLHERDQAIEIFKETVEFEKGRYIVQLPFRKSYNELSDNYPLAKQRFQNLQRFGYDSELYQQYREIIRDYTEQGIIEEVKTEITDNKLKRPVYYLPHQAVRKDGRLTSKTRIVFDVGSHQNNELSLNDCLWPGINLNPNLLDILINFRLNATAFCSDVKQAFLQICLVNEHKDAIRFLWSADEPCVHKKPKLQVYCFNRVNFGVSSSPFLLAATIRHRIEKYKHEFPDTVELLDRNFYVDDLISCGNEFEETLQTSRRAKNIMEAAGMDLRKWITNDANLMEQWKKENFNVHPVHETVRCVPFPFRSKWNKGPRTIMEH
ncbi:integrase catalytic domain-containing protein [Trichonephila clavipes]|nr:integrase catalytic domain-containing protein [Trichonephila clavipes]